ncbi:sensor histidine kinase [Gilvimarinus agarilyticus]|uniref:ATP-binding protein n=1 Tax=Gilvimarinus sp. 2_MG-2023 TaxID=3062666 RepID=UPI001C085E4B|nr:ATP-binding protein [Gilvimarinus sp. 2_MG-2023]MBU2885369.1 sensor histidine kinase [Gilvimarinus agarilyticus]MDO6570268.1 ATP-binding protein [Gilvimarinus sp. 2_MG-2023]
MHLRHLVFIRFLLILSLVLASTIAHLFSSIPVIPIAVITLTLIAVNFASLPRTSPALEIQPAELALHLLIDIAAVAILAYFTGGVSNPLLSYILVPVCIAASVLPRLYAWSLSLLAIALYSLLLFWHQPLPLFTPHIDHHSHHLPSMNIHMIGMWFNFALSALLISFFIVRMTATVRQHQDELNSLREEDLRNEQLIAVATQAAGTAHELGTPLATIKVLLGEIAADPLLPQQTQDDIALLGTQVSQCASILQKLRQRADIDQLTNPSAVPALKYCQQLLDHWQLLRPDVSTQQDLDKNLASHSVTLHPTIEQAIINVLNNAADASEEGIAIKVAIENERLLWRIIDDGKGIAPSTRPLLGTQPISTTKPDGLGIGLFLTHASIQRYGGSVSLEAGPKGGTLTTITLPLGGI